jgi:sulfur-oxidizing protein SoxZ
MMPDSAAKGDVIQIRTIISHQMETGLRHDSQGEVIPRKIINKFQCLYNGEAVFSVDLHEAVSANPFFEFYVLATESGLLEFVWEEDGGAVYRLEQQLTVA